MLIDFKEMKGATVPCMYEGVGTMTAKIFSDETTKIMPCRIHAGGAIGTHRHEIADEIDFVLSGVGTAYCDGEEEKLTGGVCHICKKGSTHSIVNTGAEDLVLLTVVVESK